MENSVKSEPGLFSTPKHRFFFESDCLALKNNHDYQLLLKTLAILEAQKMQAVKDLEELVEARDRAERDPLGFVEALKNGTLKPLPERQSVEVIPEVNWKSYTDSLQQVVQQKSAIFMNTRRQSGNHHFTKDAKTGSSANMKGNDKSRPSSYRQPWSAEEQARFEELLKIYPPEAVERRRFEKIANALGSRTTQQVASHVQKYFIKLANAGLPVPGRMPNMVKYMKSKRHRNKYSLSRPSTFFSSLSPRVYMTDGSDTACGEGSMYDDSSDDDSMLSDTDSAKELYDGISTVVCSCCDSEVKVGIYWQCMDCPEQTQLCTACVNRDFHSGDHTSSHDMRVFSVAPSNSLDKDYTNFSTQTQYNYLDPNFFPSS